MSRDFVKKSAPKNKKKTVKKKAVKKNKSQIPAWAWLFIGVILGAFIMFLTHLSDIAPSKTSGTATPTQEQASDPTSIEQKQIPKPRFDFYKLLKESEVVVRDSAPHIKATTTTQSEDYLLQVGSFKTEADADRLRAELILLNLETNIERVTVRNGETWHRVLVGPYQIHSKMAEARKVLVSNDINPLLLKRKN